MSLVIAREKAGARVWTGATKILEGEKLSKISIV